MQNLRADKTYRDKEVKQMRDGYNDKKENKKEYAARYKTPYTLAMRNKRRRDGHKATLDELVQDFRAKKTEGPTIPCTSCRKLQFPSKVTSVNKEKLQKIGISVSDAAIGEKLPLCHTCNGAIQKNKKPASWIGFGFKLNDVPESVRRLNILERQLIALRIPFMKIFSSFHETGQKKLRGNVVNVPVDIQDSVACLPRQVSHSNVIAVQLKRKMAYKSYYLFESVRPKMVWDALHDLKDKTLYRHVDVDQDWYESTMKQIVSMRAKQENDVASQQVIEREVETADAFGSIDTVVMKNDMIAVIAPGEGRKPLSLLFDPDAEEKAFPHLFGGEPRQRVNPLSVYPKVMRSELLNADRRFGQDTANLFYKLRLHVIRQINSAVNFLMVRKTKNLPFTAEEAAHDSFAADKVRTDEAYHSCLGHVVNSPAYFDREKSKVFAMIRQLGKPHIFMTLSPCEQEWEDLHKVLAEAKLGRILTAKELHELRSCSKGEIAKLIKSDPVVCAVYFNHRFQAMFKLIKDRQGIFAEHPVIHHYYRIEYQQRGSPHVHMLLWLDNVPEFDPSAH